LAVSVSGPSGKIFSHFSLSCNLILSIFSLTVASVLSDPIRL
jgi:hypothetical protein